MADLRYITLEYYLNNYNKIKDDDLIKDYLYQSERMIDTLTYNRIRNIGFINCSEYEKEIIQEVICEIANLYFQNKDILETMITEYSINGVSIKYGTDYKTILSNGILMKSSTYNKLLQTRFMTNLISWRY